MTKLKRDVRAWSKRIRMGGSRIWAVVEGANHDIPFYEGLLTDGAAVGPIGLIQAEEIEVDGSAAGGKAHALKLFRILEDIGGLSQENRQTKVDVVIFLDRDDDGYVDTLQESDHISYTHFADVEAEIVMHSDIAAAVARTFSVSRSEAREMAPDALGMSLAALWSEWIAMRLAAAVCGWSDTRFAQPSSINVPKYGHADVDRIAPICARVRANCDNWDTELERSRAHVEQLLASGEADRTVKGKWLPSYLTYLIEKSVAADRRLPTVRDAELLTACLLTIDFAVVWDQYYASRLGALIAR